MVLFLSFIIIYYYYLIIINIIIIPYHHSISGICRPGAMMGRAKRMFIIITSTTTDEAQQESYESTYIANIESIYIDDVLIRYLIL